ncbi:hypothetical protein M408DRAFT_135352 [Serendipita vermifera MAFF 305830]|uniref:Uncharacterized protein n=1 Tax=Serendipita vermifera MAFF 305830 TaxID=933852 RepID=A0A0C3A770_SERVB|nr:hypothetical protein M408DRAFT_135352 [Serendipita vermifera MAFF 305830]
MMFRMRVRNFALYIGRCPKWETPEAHISSPYPQITALGLLVQTSHTAQSQGRCSHKHALQVDYPSLHT